ncbi:P-loop containing nucleoside triphosphate hydrolase protein [Gautieria morchelliformis]|nr:P-loop containing nucleoside triphosphate hydrolase protein [Gautieria morchelliformis]
MSSTRQSTAVTHPPDVPLQILAGPGSGKTKVLTARVAYLVQEQGVPPSQICAVTFTNKAANEMKERLKKLIGSQHTDALRMGTFHALCAKFLRKYGSCISLPNNFTICDSDESKKIISKILNKYADDLASQEIQLTDAYVLASISRAKAKGLSPNELCHASTPTNPIEVMIALVYEDYVTALKESNSLDFDDLLLFGVKLFSKQPRAVMWCRHVLVDEFQDTNSMQYELMVRLASAHGCVTIVGDPDQSIYGWRSAEVTNLGRMSKDFPRTQQIFLEENYRSTGSILAACLAIVSLDKSRIAKSLRTSHAPGPRPTLQTFASEQAEAEFIALEIKRLVAHSGGMLGWKDFVVLLRYNALSRVTEGALQKEGIPNRVLAGQKFFERLEIKDILAYLQLVDNPSYTPAFIRAAHTPPRGIGEKTINELGIKANLMGISPMQLAERIYAGTTPDIKPAVKRKLESLVKPIAVLRKMANEGAPVSDLIPSLTSLIDYEAHLKKSHQDWETRWDNVQELINFASSVKINAEETLHGFSGSSDGHTSETHLRNFLIASMLSTDVETKDEDKDKEKVTISTCHSAKGLEWPPSLTTWQSVEQGIFPFYRAEDVEEERRLLYVACTRAQGLLYLSHSTYRMTAGNLAKKDLSEFVSRLPLRLFSPTPPTLTAKDRLEIANILGRDAVNEEVAQLKIQQQ